MADTALHITNFIPNPLQRSFIESRAIADLYSSRMGEGKSTALAWSAFYHTRHNPGATWVLVRDTWENMQATTMKSFFQWFPPGIYGTFHATKKEFTWAEGVARGTVQFLGMDDPSDASKLMSREFAGMGIDEPAPAVGSAGVDEMIFDIGLSRLRQPDMKWYCMKLAENNPDEAHWTYNRFVDPGTEGFKVWQPPAPENTKNLPADYYANLRKMWAHRPDLVRRFVEGEFGFQLLGKSVTPQWSDRRHLAVGLVPVPRQELTLAWDFGHNPTCLVTQKTPLGSWLVLDAMVGENLGVEELIQDAVKPLVAERYRGFPLFHVGDPAGEQREQTSIHRTPVMLIKKLLGGRWRSGPQKWLPRIEPLRAVLTREIGGSALVRVDKERAAAVWHALRGGWHHHIARTGVIAPEALKNIHSHPGDALSYAAAILFPLGKNFEQMGGLVADPPQGSYFGRSQVGDPFPSRAIRTTYPSHGDPLPRNPS